MSPQVKKPPRCRARDLGINIGFYEPGPYNAITDVDGVRVGHTTIVRGSGSRGSKTIARTGVTAIVPASRDVFMESVMGGAFVLNGAGELAGLTQINEWGLIETPILLTNTLAVGACSEGVVQYMTEKHSEIGNIHDVVIPVVGECDDSWLNEIIGRHVKPNHAIEAIEKAAPGPVTEGSVGGGTGMITCDFKAGIGTSSRRVRIFENTYTVGVLVMSNFGVMRDLRIDGKPIGRLIAPEFAETRKREKNYGSIIAVLATDAPLLSHQLQRLAKRMSLGVGRVGSMAAHGSGEIMLAFSTANRVPRESTKPLYSVETLKDIAIDPLYGAAIEATEEAILNSLFASDTMEGVAGHTAQGLPIDRVRELLSRP
ncbi:S58 family peptidase [bacterium]|nr:S58 family peptidase [bacterium]